MHILKCLFSLCLRALCAVHITRKNHTKSIKLILEVVKCVTEQKPKIFAYKLKYILFPQLIAALNNYPCSLPPLANVNCDITGLLFQSAFCQPCKSTTGAMVPMQGSNLAVGT